MKTKIRILGNLLQKIAIFKEVGSGNMILANHIVILDWVVSPYPITRDIGTIIEDKDYTLSPREYFEKYNKME